MNRSHLKAWVLTGSIVSALLYAQAIVAQVVPDATLPVGERSQVTGNPTVQIDGGARRGDNLFHSFSQFSIPMGGSAYFNNAADVQNIFSRVTGGSISNIDGLIRANGAASLFLLNPNGILFGPNASLNIGGSFVATTANAIGFLNGEVFSSDATQALPSQLLTVNPNALFFNQLSPQPIINQSIVNGTGLQVSPRQNLLLVGGAVQLENGRLTSPGSYVELGGVGGIGTVGLATAGEDWQLAISDRLPRADISLRNGGHIVVGSPALSRNIGGIIVIGDSGSIRILGRNIDLLGSSLWVEIPSASRLPDTRTGGIELNATGSIAISDSVIANRLFGQGTIGSITLTAGDRVSFANNSRLYNTVDSGGVGNTGDLNITTGSLSLIEGTQLISGTRGLGNTGNVNINARDTVSLDSYGNITFNTGIFNIKDKAGIGNVGDINVTTGSLFFTNGAQLNAFTMGRGNAGNVNIHARDTVSFDKYSLTGDTSDGILASGILTEVFPSAVGQGGNVNITTGSLFLTNGGIVNTANLGGAGNSGRVTVEARDSVQIRGTSPTNRSGISTSVASESVGNGGDVSIATASLSASDQAIISTNAQGQGRAGKIRIQASGAVLFDEAAVTSTLDAGGVGRGGDIEIAARSLSVLNGAYLSASTAGNGDAGNITVKTPDLQLSGASSGLFAQTTSTGNAGNLTIRPRENEQDLRVNLQQGAQISASTSGLGRGGQLTIAAPGSITLTGTGSIITAGTGSSGTGGDLSLQTGTLNIQDQAEVTVSSLGTGSAGNLFVDAARIFLNNQGGIRADTTGGGGNINLRSPFILLRNGSNITTNATGANIPGGNIAIDTRFLIAVLNEDSNISANSEDFRGGNVRINAFSIFGIRPSPISTPLSDITATGATSALSGTIDVITSGLDPTSGLVALPTDLADSSGLIAQGCPANQGNSFVITGRGGLPPTPEQQLDDDAAWGDRRRLVVAGRGGHGDTGTRGHGESNTNLSASPRLPFSASSTPSTPILEATGWQITSTGEVFLVATTPAPIAQNPLNQPIACPEKP